MSQKISGWFLKVEVHHWKITEGHPHRLGLWVPPSPSDQFSKEQSKKHSSRKMPGIRALRGKPWSGIRYNTSAKIWGKAPSKTKQAHLDYFSDDFHLLCIQCSRAWELSQTWEDTNYFSNAALPGSLTPAFQKCFLSMWLWAWLSKHTNPVMSSNLGPSTGYSTAYTSDF